MNSLKLIEKQKEFVRSGVTLAKSYRLTQLKKMKHLIVSNQSRIEEALFKDLKKSNLEAFVTEISSTLREIEHSLKHLDRWMGEKKWHSPFLLFPSRSRIIKEPYGSILIVSPWNYPFHLSLTPAIAAICAGNSVVIKPSEISSHTEGLLVNLINNNFEEELIKVVVGGVEISKNLTSQPFDFIFFTGSSSVGKQVMKAASQNLVPLCLELGGKSPCIVDEDVNLSVTAKRIVWGKFTNAGQTCVAPDFLYVHKNIKADLIEYLKEELVNFYGKNPAQSCDFGRIINEKHFNRLLSLLDQGEIIWGGEHERESLYIAPTLIGGVSWEDPIMGDEIFGPLLPIFTFIDSDRLLYELQRKPKPLAFYLFTNNKLVKKKFLNQLSFGGGCVNDTLVHLTDPNLPFGGVGNSGMGSYHGKAGFKLFSHSKSVVDKSFHLDLPVRYPPYNLKKSKILKMFLSVF